MKTLSIRTQLLAMGAATLAALLVLSLFFTFMGRAVGRSHARSLVRSVSRVSANELGLFLRDTRTTLSRLSTEHSGLTGDSRSQCHGRLLRVNQMLPGFANVFEVDAAGRVLCSSLELGETEYSVDGVPWFESLERGTATTFGEPLVGEVSGEWVAVVAHEVRDADGELRGAVAAAVDLQRFQQLLEDVSLPPDGVVTLAERDGTIVARSREPERWVGSSLDFGAPDLDLSSPGARRMMSADGVDRYFGWTPVPSSPWVVFAGLPTTWIDAPSRRAVLSGSAVALVLLLAVGGLAVMLHRQVTDALETLLDRARKSGTGDPPDGEPIDAPAEIRAVTEQLDRMLEDRANLEAQLHQSQKMEAVGRLAGGIAHDFNNLLTVIQGEAAVAREDLPDGHPAGTSLDQVLEAADRAGALTAQLLVFSRRREVDPQPVNLTDTAERLETMLRRIIGRDIRLETDLEPELPDVWADPTQIEQVLMNLVVNARDAMPEGGTLAIRTRIDREEAGDGRPWIRLEVSDTGTGIPPEHLSRIFEPFFTSKGPEEGTGLGLATAYAIVDRYGGQIRVASTEGQGATFVVRLPSIDEDAT